MLRELLKRVQYQAAQEQGHQAFQQVRRYLKVWGLLIVTTQEISGYRIRQLTQGQKKLFLKEEKETILLDFQSGTRVRWDRLWYGL